ncbi:MAG: thermonuclease family protein [Pseudomonadota bacterium]|nr:thermonuclease family protein [Pseudomonadota bacterium]
MIDGDTIWLNGDKIRIADINTPETSEPACAYEAQLGAQATARLTQLLNQGAFAVAPNPDGRDEDQYGRKLRVLTRGGESLGDTLVAEGLAEEWQGYRREWC